jgi:hypothetical protein
MIEMIILNFSHPLTEKHLEAIAQITNQEIEQVVTVTVQFDVQLPFKEQLETLVQAIPLTPEELQTLPVLVNLPSLNHIAALVLAYLHGLMGFFPAIVRLAPISDTVPVQFDVVEVIDLSNIRDLGRKIR